MAVIEPYPSAEPAVLYAKIAGLLREEGVIAVPTETYYGLGVNPFDSAAVARLHRVKGRPDGKPILILIGELAQLGRLVAGVPPAARVLMERFWPGPLTMVFPANATLSHDVTAGTGTVGVRLTSCGPLAEILRQVGPLTGTSANRSGEPPVRTAADVDRTLGDRIDLIVDGGSTPGGLPSTVVSVCHGVELVRAGALERMMIQHALEAQGFHLKAR